MSFSPVLRKGGSTGDCELTSPHWCCEKTEDSFVASLITRANKVEPASTSTSTSNSTSFDFSEMKEELEKNVAISADLRAQHERDVNTIEHLEQVRLLLLPFANCLTFSLSCLFRQTEN